MGREGEGCSHNRRGRRHRALIARDRKGNTLPRINTNDTDRNGEALTVLTIQHRLPAGLIRVLSRSYSQGCPCGPSLQGSALSSSLTALSVMVIFCVILPDYVNFSHAKRTTLPDSLDSEPSSADGSGWRVPTSRPRLKSKRVVPKPSSIHHLIK
jgi:hypothetical protein